MENFDIGLALVLAGISFFVGLLGTRVNDHITNYQRSPNTTDRNWALLFIGLFCALCAAFILMGFGILSWSGSSLPQPVDIKLNINCSTGAVNITEIACTQYFSCPPPTLCPQPTPSPSFVYCPKPATNSIILDIPKLTN